MNTHLEPISVLLVALYRYQNFPIRIMHSLLENIDGVKPYTVFFKNYYTNALKDPTAREEDLFSQLIAHLKPGIVGFSVYSPYISIARRLTSIVKDNSPALVLWGGIHPTLSPESCIREAHLICVGEGEGALSDLVLALRDGRDYRHIENLWVRSNAHVIRNPIRPLVQDLDSVPFPALARDSFYFIGSNKITREDPTLIDPILAIIPARGCPFRCSFCVNSLLHPLYKNLGRYSRRRSVPNVIAELKEALSIPGNRKKIIEFHDENFGTDGFWLSEFESLYPREIGLPFKVQYNPSLVKSATIERLVKCGLHRIKFGIEAGTDRIRNQVFNRPGKNSDIVKLAHEISGYDVKIRYDLIIDNPYDTEESLKETIRFLLRLPKPLRFNLYSLQFFPDYPLTRRAIEDGHINEEEASLDRLQKKMARNWAFVPKLSPFTKRQILQNVVWLVAYGHTSDGIVNRAVGCESSISYLYLIYLNLKAIWLGKIQAFKRLLYRKKY